MSEKRRTGRLGGIELLAQDAADDAFRTVKEEFETAPGDSPIEKLLFVALRTVARQGGRIFDSICLLRKGEDLEKAVKAVESFEGRTDECVFVQTQAQLDGWRVDFLLHFHSTHRGIDDPMSSVIVECDGHDFHERTKVQAQRDRSCDRLAQAGGVPVLRFTGSEIWNDPWACADEVLAFMENAR